MRGRNLTTASRRRRSGGPFVLGWCAVFLLTAVFWGMADAIRTFSVPEKHLRHGAAAGVGAGVSSAALSSSSSSSVAPFRDGRGDLANQEGAEAPLSAELILTIGPVRGTMDSAARAMLSVAVTLFLERVFEAQTRYADLSVRGVEVLRQYSVAGSDISRAGPAASVGMVEVESFVAAQYRPGGDGPPLTVEAFGDILQHVFGTFERNLIQILKEQEEGEWRNRRKYFEDVEVATMAIRAGGAPGANSFREEVLPKAGRRTKAAAIVALTFVGVATVSLLAALLWRWNAREVKWVNPMYTTVKSEQPADLSRYNIQNIVQDDLYSLYSFSPFQEETGTKSIFRKSAEKLRGKKIITPDKNGKDSTSAEKSSAKAAPSDSSTVDEDYAETAKAIIVRPNECYAPPGKLGVAIDNVDGRPVVHRIKDGSPLKNILLHGDTIIAIDGTDTHNMSAAEVTKLMVKGMSRVRKISFTRRSTE